MVRRAVMGDVVIEGNDPVEEEQTESALLAEEELPKQESESDFTDDSEADEPESTEQTREVK